MADRAIGEHRHIGRAAADVDQHHAQFLFIGREHRIGGRHRLQDQVRHFQAAAAHALDDVLHRRHGAGDDMHLHLQADAAHADRLAHIFLAVDDELLRHRVQQLLIGRNVNRFCRLDDARHVGGRHFLVLDGHHAAGIEAADMAAGDARIHIADLAVGHQLGLFQRALDGLHRGLDIDHHAFFQALRFVLAQPDHFVAPVGHHFGYHRHHFRGADVEADDQVFRVFCHFCRLVFWANN